MPSIFLCHSHKDKPFVRMLGERLQSHGIRTWIDEAEMQVGDSLIAKIETAIQEFTYLGVILSPNSVSSEWVLREVNIALSEEIQGRRVKVLPILYKKCDIPGFLATKVYVDLSEDQDFEEGFKKLLARLTSDLYDEKYKQKRAYEILQAAYLDWISFEKKDHQLLSRNNIILIIDNLAQFNLSLDLVEYLFCSVSFLSTSEGLDIDQLQLWLHKIGPSDISHLFDRLLKHPNPRVRAGSAKLIQQLAESNAIDVLIDRIQQENDRDVRRACLESLSRLGKQLPKELALTLLENDKDWLVQSYTLLSLSEYRTCLLISDGTDFAVELGTIAQEAGFKLVTLTTSFPLLEIAEVEDEILKVYELLLLVRGEHYSQNMFSAFYKRLTRFVAEGGSVFATSWVSWETRHHFWFTDVLPFVHIQDIFSEDVMVTCQPTGSELAQKIFPTQITYRTSFEMLRPKRSSITLFETETGIPIFGYHQFWSGICYYFNTCQHSCLSLNSMPSPLQTNPELYACLERVFEWIYRTMRSLDST